MSDRRLYVTLKRGDRRRLHASRSCPTLAEPGTAVRAATPIETERLSRCRRCAVPADESGIDYAAGDRSYQRALRAAASDGGVTDE